MPNTNNTTNNNFSTNQNVSDKHLSYFNQPGQPVQPTPNPTPVNQNVPNPVRIPQIPPQTQQAPQNPRPTNPAPLQNQQQNLRPRVSTPPQPQNIPQIQQPQPIQVQRPANQAPTNVQTPQNPQVKYLNPNNINQNQAPKSMNDLRVTALDSNRGLPPEQKALNVQHYDKLSQPPRQITINTFEVLKLCIYIVPGVQVFLLLFKSIKDADVLWHARQSLVTQAIWLTAYFILQNIGAPLISGSGFTVANIWNLFMIGVLVFAGYKAYIGQRWRIPIISDIGTTYIDGRSANN